MKLWYWAITTLSTIGFGDYSPQSTVERYCALPILMFGVIIFSMIMGDYMDILMQYKTIGEVTDNRGLSKWISLLSRFNNGQPLGKDLISKIEDFFDYYWDNNRLSCIDGEGQRFMDELPERVKGEIYIDYLFSDFLYKYRFYFKPENLIRDPKRSLYLTQRQL